MHRSLCSPFLLGLERVAEAVSELTVVFADHLDQLRVVVLAVVVVLARVDGLRLLDEVRHLGSHLDPDAPQVLRHVLAECFHLQELDPVVEDLTVTV